MKKFLILFLPFFLFSIENSKTADLIIFSYNRPLQILALLESIDKFVSNLNQISVLYRVGNEDISKAYDQIIELYPKIQWVKQGLFPRQDFKPLLLECIAGTSAEYVVFAVDDDIVKDHIDMEECVDALEKTNAFCFYFRLGDNITVQYNSEVALIPPKRTEVKKNIFLYYLDDGNHGDWRYPNNLDMTLYKKERILPFFKTGTYHSPNTLEGNWAGISNLNDYGLFYKQSKMFSLPINMVQEDWINPCERTFSAQELLEFWKEGLKMDLEPYHFLNNSCPFVSQKPTFKKR